MAIPRSTFSSFVLIINEFGQASEKSDSKDKRRGCLRWATGFGRSRLFPQLIRRRTRFGRMAKIKLVF